MWAKELERRMTIIMFLGLDIVGLKEETMTEGWNMMGVNGEVEGGMRMLFLGLEDMVVGMSHRGRVDRYLRRKRFMGLGLVRMMGGVDGGEVGGMVVGMMRGIIGVGVGMVVVVGDVVEIAIGMVVGEGLRGGEGIGITINFVIYVYG
jgi:hypothetical protein